MLVKSAFLHNSRPKMRRIQVVWTKSTHAILNSIGRFPSRTMAAHGQRISQWLSGPDSCSVIGPDSIFMVIRIELLYKMPSVIRPTHKIVFPLDLQVLIESDFLCGERPQTLQA